MRLRRALLIVGFCLTLPQMPAAAQTVSVGPGGGTPGTSSNFELIGHSDLLGRDPWGRPTGTSRVAFA